MKITLHPANIKSIISSANRPIFFILLSLLAQDLFAQPIISSFAPTSGLVGTTVTITGANFSTTPANNIVYFGAVQANVSSASTTSLTVTVPAGTTYQPITVTTNGLTGYSGQPFITTFSVNNISFTPVSFAPRVSFAANTQPFGISISDLDGDGKSDVAAASSNAQSFSILRNTSTNGTISFVPKTDFATAAIPNNIAIADVDGNGKPDVVVPNGSSNTFSVFINTSSIGTISFAAKVDFITGANPEGIAIADIDGDGKPDVAVTNGGNVSVFPNTSTTGTVSFAAKIDFAMTGTGGSVSIGDLNHDNKPEILVTNVFSNSISVFRNTSSSGTVSMAAKVDYATGYGPQNICIGDLDGDGNADLAIGCNQTINAFRNTGSGGNITFATVQSLMPTGGHYITLGDFNGDGRIDIGSVRVTFNEFLVLRNTSVPGFIIFNQEGSYQPGLGSFTLFAGDLDGDGKPDVAFPNYGSDKVSVLRNRFDEPNITSFIPVGGCSTAGSTITITGSNFTGAATVSFGGVPATSFIVNTDNSITAIAAATITGTVSVTTPNGTGILAYPPPTITSFNPATASPGSNVTIKGTYLCEVTSVSLGGIAASSFVINADTSITAVVGSGASGNVSVTSPYGTGTLAGFYNGPVISSFSPALGPAGTTVTITGTNFNSTPADNLVFFGANQAEVITGNSIGLTVVSPIGATYQAISVTTSNFTAYASRPFVVTFAGGDTISTASFTAKVDFITGTNPSDVSIGDLDGDGKDDLAVTNKQSNSVSIFRNTSFEGSITSGSFAPKADLTTGTSPASVSIGDINGDGKPDLVVCNNGSSSVSIFRNTSTSGTISFAPKIDFNAGSEPTKVIIGDLDGDGKPDLAFSSDSSYGIWLLRNTGSNETISFTASGSYFSVGGISMGISIGDLDGDGKPEVIVARNELSSISVFKNTSVRGTISFAAKVDFTVGTEPYSLFIGDLDGDTKADLAIPNKSSNTVSILRNTSAGGTISFAPKIDYATGLNPVSIAIDDLDGTGKPDLAVTNLQSGTVSLFRNKSTSGSISFSNKIDYTTGGQPSGVSIGDFDGDGKTDLAVSNQQSNTVSILRNKSGEPIRVQLCPGGNTSLTSNLSGLSYQWQINTGTGFTNLSDNSNYTGTHSINLQLNTIPSSWYGYLYRCIVDGNNSNLFSLKFENNWTGSVSTAWENPLNWSCGTVPDLNTDVIINSGTVVINSNTTIRSLTLAPGVDFTVNPGVTLTITH